MKKGLLLMSLLIGSLAMAEGFVIEPNVSGNLLQSAKTKVGSEEKSAIKLKRGYGLGAEVRTEVYKGLELGGGLSLEGVPVDRKGILDYKLGRVGEKELKGVVVESSGLVSVPLYVVGKYNFDLGSEREVKPYVKGKVGYSINNYNVNINSTTASLGGITRHFKVNQKGENSVYFGLGAGVEFKNWNVGLSYDFNDFKVKERAEAVTEALGISGEGKSEGSHKVKNRTLKVNVGYAFKF